ncbi:MAG: restriction endonuclease subunit S [Pirellulaceae bacterium]
MAKWRHATLGDVCDEVHGLIQTGPFGSQLHQSDYSDLGIPVVMPKDIVEGRIDTTTIARVSSEHVKRLSRHKLSSGDIVYGRRGDIGRQALVRPEQAGWMCGTGCMRIRLGESIVQPLCLHYYLRQDDMVRWITKQAVGATMPNLNTEILRSIPIKFPPLPIQRRIAGILSAYDELIENSQRRIKILESMARALYREWFVHFRFPGHESVPRVPSPLGEIPQGWEVRKLADFVTTKYGYTESTNVEPVGPKYLRGMDINKTSFIDWSQVPYCPISQEDHEAYRLKVGDVLVIRMADPGKVGIVEQEVDAVFASYLIRIAPKYERLSPYFLFYLMESAEYYAYITGASTGTTRKSASAGVIADYPFAVPPQNLISQFEERASEFRSLLTTLLKQVVNLRRTRDLLLPRLLSGQIDVEALDHA